MENRFGVKDFVIFSLLVVMIVVGCLLMKQIDRQWDQLRSISSTLEDQSKDLRDVHDQLSRGVVVNENSGTGSASQNSPFGPNDPFDRIEASQKLSEYAKGDWLVTSLAGHVAKLTPLLSGDMYAQDIQGEILESLAVRNPDTLDWKGLLAKSWQISPDGLRITFQLRDGLHFSDGEPLTADDVVFSYSFIMNDKINCPRDRSAVERITSVTKTGPLEVVFAYKEPFFQAFDLAASIFILPKHFYSKFTPEDFNQSVGYVLGSGPYRMEDPIAWKPGKLIELVRNERYWGVRPGFNRLVYKEFGIDKARLAAFRNGEIDDFYSAAPEQYRDMLADPQLVARTQHFNYQDPLWGYRYVAWNEKRDDKPSRFADKRVRQAMTMLLDRERMVQQIELGYAVVATSPFSPAGKQCDPSIKPWPYDPDKAIQLLKDAGFAKVNDQGVRLAPDGTPFRFKLTYPSGSGNYDAMVLIIKDALAHAQIVVDPDPLEWATFTDRLENKNFEAITLGWGTGIEDDIYQMFDSSQMIAGGDDFISYKNPELDQTIEQARRTVADDQRMTLWHKAHAIIHEDQPYTFLFFPKHLRFVDARIHNVEVIKLGLNPLEEWFVPRLLQKYTQ